MSSPYLRPRQQGKHCWHERCRLLSLCASLVPLGWSAWLLWQLFHSEQRAVEEVAANASTVSSGLWHGLAMTATECRLLAVEAWACNGLFWNMSETSMGMHSRLCGSGGG